MKSFIIFQFIYCALIWMTQSRGRNNKVNHILIWMILSRWLNNKISYIHEKALLIVYKDFSTSFEELSAKISP